ncbi:hypothetical protein G9A89_018986 [Geosiphon pyriformis]|nr:hypothetical protein G9A89_018986 [Geosiphon pyriformis]
MKIKEKEKKRKKEHHQPPPFIIPTPTTLHNNPIIDGQGLCASIVARNCHQWAHAVATMRNTTPQQSFTVIYAYSNTLDDQRGKENGIANLILLDKEIWNNILERGGTYNVSCQYTILISNWIEKRTPIEAAWRRAIQQLNSCPHDDNELWQMATAKIEGASSEEIRTIKNNPPEPIGLDWDAEPVINFLEPEEFHEHYQNLALTRKKQEQWLAQLNTRLCCHCLILSNFEYCDNCDLIYNPPPCMIYTIPEEEESISSCTSELELLLNPDSNSDNNDDENNGSSSIQNSNDNDNNINSDSNSDSSYEQYIVLPDLTKEQELK